MSDEEGRKHAALRELSDADRMYRAAFQELTTAPRLSPSSFASLHLAVMRLEEVVRHLEANAGRDEESPMTPWEYLIVALPQFQPPTTAPGGSAAVEALNREGQEGWEAVGMTALADGTVAVLLKRPREA